MARTTLMTSGDSNKSNLDDRPSSGNICGSHTTSIGIFQNIE